MKRFALFSPIANRRPRYHVKIGRYHLLVALWCFALGLALSYRPPEMAQVTLTPLPPSTTPTDFRCLPRGDNPNPLAHVFCDSDNRWATLELKGVTQVPLLTKK